MTREEMLNRLEKLKQEWQTVRDLKCLSFELKDKVLRYYDTEIRAIELYGLNNPEGGISPALELHYKRLAEHYDKVVNHD